MSETDPHGEEPVIQAGEPPARARLAMVLIHGRGGSARDMLGLAEHLEIEGAACRAPQAAMASWWPQSFLAPLAANQPQLDSALRAVGRTVDALAADGLPPERIVLLGFSQGACLALEYAARHGRPFRAVIGLSGGLIGSADAQGDPRHDLDAHPPKLFDYANRLDGVPFLVTCHEQDPHIPLVRVRESERVLKGLGADVSTLIHPGPGHSVVEEEVHHLRRLLSD